MSRVYVVPAQSVHRHLRPAKIDDQLVHVRAFLETRGETRDVDRVTLVNTAYQYAHEIWPDDRAIIREHADRVARLAEYRAAFDQGSSRQQTPERSCSDHSGARFTPWGCPALLKVV